MQWVSTREERIIGKEKPWAGENSPINPTKIPAEFVEEILRIASLSSDMSQINSTKIFVELVLKLNF